MEPEELIADLDKELRSVLGALQNFAPVTEDVTLSDETGTVHVTVRPDMSVASVAVAPAWREKVEAAALAGVLSDVLGRAQARAMGFDIDALEAAGPEPVEVDEHQVDAARDALLRRTTDELFSPVTEDVLQQRIDELPGTMDALIAKLDVEIERMQNSTDAQLPQDPEDFTPDESFGDQVHSENRMVSVRVAAGLIADVDIKEGWLEGRSGIVLTECFNQIIEQLPDVVAAQNAQGARP